jgi:hypothetical protein
MALQGQSGSSPSLPPIQVHCGGRAYHASAGTWAILSVVLVLVFLTLTATMLDVPSLKSWREVWTGYLLPQDA